MYYDKTDYILYLPVKTVTMMEYRGNDLQLISRTETKLSCPNVCKSFFGRWNTSFPCSYGRMDRAPFHRAHRGKWHIRDLTDIYLCSCPSLWNLSENAVGTDFGQHNITCWRYLEVSLGSHAGKRLTWVLALMHLGLQIENTGNENNDRNTNALNAMSYPEHQLKCPRPLDPLNSLQSQARP